MTQRVSSDLIPVAPGSRLLGMSRERVLRRLQDGRIRGEYIDGRWFIKRDEIPSDDVSVPDGDR